MEWLTRMKDALDYMERNMEETLSIEDIAKVACSSPFHFQRMFNMLTGVTVADYIRKRRLTLAVQELTMTTAKVIDVSYKYGYDSPESFAKAFRKAHGVSPSAARSQGVQLKAFPRLSFHLSLKGDQEMEYKIIEREPFLVIGKKWDVTCKDGENLRVIPQLWQEVNRDGTSDKIMEIGGDQDILGICIQMKPANENFYYWIAVESPTGTDPQGFETTVIPAATWAVFTSTGPMPHAIQSVWKRIFEEWFPSTGYEHTGGPEFELYLPGDPGADDYRCEIWIPVKKK